MSKRPITDFFSTRDGQDIVVEIWEAGGGVVTDLAVHLLKEDGTLGLELNPSEEDWSEANEHYWDWINEPMDERC